MTWLVQWKTEIRDIRCLKFLLEFHPEGEFESPL